MSHYLKIETQIKNKSALVKALCRMGFKENQIEVHDTPVNLYGYQGDKRADEAEVVIRRQNVGSASNDIGFKLQEDGTYKAIISEYDSGKYNKPWTDKMCTYYEVEQSKELLAQNGWMYQESLNDQGEIQLIGTTF